MRPIKRRFDRRPQIIIALDVDTLDKARYFVGILYPKIKIFKVGSQLFTASGDKIVKLIQRKGASVFLDLKFFDIPNTVANAIRSAVRLKVGMLTLHILGGKNMLKAAVEAAKKEARILNLKPPLLMGVTILTSKKARSSEVLKLARVGLNCGLDGIVCSVKEAKFLRQRIKKQFLIVTPGIRINKTTADDQKRIATISQAVKAGSDFLVIGRPVLKAKKPLSLIKKILRVEFNQ